MTEQGITINLAPPLEVLVVGGGPAALAIASALGEQGVSVGLLASENRDKPWPNTYGIWGEEVDALGLGHLLSFRWSHTSSYFGSGDASHAEAVANAPTDHGRDYGLFDQKLLQKHWLDRCDATGVRWFSGTAKGFSVVDAAGLVCSPDQAGARSCVTCADGRQVLARLVVDASGHQPALLQRADWGPVAFQAAYGVVGRFSHDPVQRGQFVLMDYRCDHLSEAERQEVSTFLYAMDLGHGRFFVEETSLALAPPVPFETLQQRLQKRLAHRGITIEHIEHEEFCLFPMNLALPCLHQPLLGFGGSAAMVHPASGYLVGGLLRRAPGVARALATGLDGEKRLGTPLSPAELAAMGWEALWPLEMRRKHALYQFGLEKLMRFQEDQLRAFFRTFFGLPAHAWYGFLSNTLSLSALIAAMVQLFLKASWGVRLELIRLQGRELGLLLRLVWPRA